MNRKIERLYDSGDLQSILTLFEVEEVVQELSFEKSIKLAWHMLFNDYFDSEQSEFGVNLLFALKKLNTERWNSDWRNEAFLGIACDNTYRYEERYNAFKRAYDSAQSISEDDHPGLLISLARCHSAPGPLIIPYEKCLELAKRAIKDKIFPDAAWALSGIYAAMEDQNSYRRWRTIAEKLEEEGIEMSPHIYPDFLWREEICPKQDLT